MIRFIIETVSSKHDVNGNSYHYATITSTKTVKRFFIKDCGGVDTAAHYVRKVAEWDEIYSTQFTYPISQYKTYAKYIREDPKALYEHQITSEMILALETETKTKTE